MGLLWGWMGVVIRQVDVPAVAVVWSRLVFAAPALAWFVRRHDSRPLRLRPTRLVLLNGLILAVHWTTFVATLQRAPIGMVLLITNLAPVGIARLPLDSWASESACGWSWRWLWESAASLSSLRRRWMGSTAAGVRLAVVTGGVCRPGTPRQAPGRRVLGWLLLDERPALLTGRGGLAIVAGGLLALRTPADEVLATTPPAVHPTGP